MYNEYMKTNLLITNLISLILVTACNINIAQPSQDNGNKDEISGPVDISDNQESQYVCVIEDAFNKDQPIDLVYTITIGAGLFPETSSICEVIDPSTGAQLAVDQSETDFCRVDYLDDTFISKSDSIATVEMMPLGENSQSLEYKNCEKIY